MHTDAAHELPGFGQPRAQTWKESLRGLTIRQTASKVVDFLKPELLSRRKAPHGRLHDKSKTAWLDGLRGWAALLVCFFHLNLWTHEGINSCYGATLSSGETNTTPAAWPIIRSLWTGGHFSVALFFTISGYVVPKRLLSLLHEGRQADFMSALHSAVCRRPFRLFIPIIWSTLAAMVVSRVTGLPISMPYKDSMLQQLEDWTRQMGQYLYFFGNGLNSYNYQTWSIPVELRGSVSMFAWLFALSHTPHKTRFFLTLALIWYLVFAAPAAQLATFFAGMITAEIDLKASGAVQMSLPWDGLLQALGRHKVLRVLLLHGVLGCALYLGGEPSGQSSRDASLGDCHGWVTLGKLIPEAYPHGKDDSNTWLWFWLFWASWLFILAGKEIGWLKRFLETSFSQYLGRISFALYLIHGPMISFFSERTFFLMGVKKPMDEGAISIFGDIERKWYDASWFPFTDSGPYGLEPNWLFCLALSIVVDLYLAELGTKVLDIPSVRISRWVYSKYLKPS